MVREPPLTPAARLDLEPVDEIDDVVEASTSAAANAVAGDRDGKMALAGSGPTDQYRIALLVDEAAGGNRSPNCVGSLFFAMLHKSSTTPTKRCG